MGALTSFLLGGLLVSGPQLQHCRLGGVVFTSDSAGMAFDLCGSVFVTKDGGATWTPGASPVNQKNEFSTSLSLGARLADGSVLLAGYVGAQVFRSADDGRTWSSVPVPEGQWFYSLSHVGPHAWLCGSSGAVLASADSGKSWAAAKKSPTDSDDRCISLSFLDGKRGWVGGWYGHVFETNDGGSTWTPLSLPPAFRQTGAQEQTLTAVWRVDAKVGFVSGEPGLFRTIDGGKTWTLLDVPADAPTVSVTLADGRRALITARSAKSRAEEWEPVLAAIPSERGKAGVVTLQGESIHYYDASGLSRVGRITGTPSGESPRLETFRPAGGSSRSGFDVKRGFLSDDGGASWLELAPLPNDATFSELVFLSERTALARTKEGALLRSGDAGRSWRASTDPLDRYDLARATKQKADEPLRCLRESPRGEVSVRFGAQGCFGGNENVLRLTWNERGATGRTTLDELRKGAAGSLTLNPGQTRQRLNELAELATRGEVPSQCTSTTEYQAKLKVSCELEGKRRVETLQLVSHDCNGREGLAPGVGGATSSGRGDEGYARAIGVHNWALDLIHK